MATHLALATRLKSPACGGREPTAVGGGPTPPQPPLHQYTTHAKVPHHCADFALPYLEPEEGRKEVKAEKQTYFCPRNSPTRNSLTHLQRNPHQRQHPPRKHRRGRLPNPRHP